MNLNQPLKKFQSFNLLSNSGPDLKEKHGTSFNLKTTKSNFKEKNDYDIAQKENICNANGANIQIQKSKTFVEKKISIKMNPIIFGNNFSNIQR